MSDTGTTGVVESPAAVSAGEGGASAEGISAPAPAPTASASTGAPGVGEVDALADLPTDQAVFDRGYVERIRAEGAKHRVAAREAAEKLNGYEQVFGQYDEVDRGVWLDLARTWATDPAAAAQTMDRIARAVLADGGTQADVVEAQQEAMVETIAAELPGLTTEAVRAEVNAALAERAAAEAQEKAIQSVHAELREAGFDPNSADGFAVMWTANHETGGDLQAAIAQRKAAKQAIIDEYVAERARGGPLPAPDGGAGTGAPPEILNLDQAGKAARSWLEGQWRG
jgi:hypothetical protein